MPNNKLVYRRFNIEILKGFFSSWLFTAFAWYIFLEGLRVTNPTIRWCVRLSVSPSVTILRVNTITQQILVALGPSLYHRCISGVSWLSSKIYDLDLFFEVIGGRFQHENVQFSLVDTITQQILVSLGPNLCHGCILGVLVKFEDGIP